MKVAIILGNRLNDDGSISKIQEQRLKMAFELEKDLCPDYFILSGGIANPIPNKSEAAAMYEYLVSHGFNDKKIILEDKSHSTKENALFSLPIIEKLNPDTVIVCTSDYHLGDPVYGTMSHFIGVLKDKKIKFMTYTIINIE